MAYSEMTVGDRNPVKRWIHRRRFVDALGRLPNLRAGGRPRVLDFGAGDGELICQMMSFVPIDACIYEPSPQLMAEAKQKLSGMDSVAFVEHADALVEDSFDYVFCLEVFEHLPAAETLRAIADIRRVLKPGGFAVVGVPHELFIPALLKGLFRMCRRYGDFDAIPSNILASALGRPPLHRPMIEIAPGLRFHSHHLGFDHRVLARTFEAQLSVQRKWFGPLRLFGALLNSEVYFLLKKAPSVGARNC